MLDLSLTYVTCILYILFIRINYAVVFNVCWNTVINLSNVQIITLYVRRRPQSRFFVCIPKEREIKVCKTKFTFRLHDYNRNENFIFET